MAELFWENPDERIFDVTVEGEAWLTNFDIVAETGGRRIAGKYEFVASVLDGVISIEFTAVKDNAQVSGIEVTAA